MLNIPYVQFLDLSNQSATMFQLRSQPDCSSTTATRPLLTIWRTNNLAAQFSWPGLPPPSNEWHTEKVATARVLSLVFKSSADVHSSQRFWLMPSISSEQCTVKKITDKIQHLAQARNNKSDFWAFSPPSGASMANQGQAIRTTAQAKTIDQGASVWPKCARSISTATQEVLFCSAVGELLNLLLEIIFAIIQNSTQSSEMEAICNKPFCQGCFGFLIRYSKFDLLNVANGNLEQNGRQKPVHNCFGLFEKIRICDAIIQNTQCFRKLDAEDQVNFWAGGRSVGILKRSSNI